MNFSILSQINWIAVLVAAIGYFAMGALWFSKALFGERWARFQHFHTEAGNSSSGSGVMLFSFLFIIINCLALALLIVQLNLIVFRSAIVMGILVGIGFSGTAIASRLVYRRQSALLYCIECGYHLMGTMVAAVILVLWR